MVQYFRIVVQGRIFLLNLDNSDLCHGPVSRYSALSSATLEAWGYWFKV